MKLFTKFGLIFAVIFLFTGCHTIVFINEYEEEAVVEEEIAEPPIAAQIMLDLTPFLIRELIFNSESYPHHMHPVNHGNKSQAGGAGHAEKQRSVQTGSGSSDSNTQSGNRDSDRQNTRDSGIRRGGR